MLTVWRLVTARFAESAFSGEGARLYGGRWNRKGIAMVYTAATQSLAMLEMLVQDEPLRARYVVIPARIPSGLHIDRIAADTLPDDWRTPAAREQLQDMGSDWAKGGSAAVLAVPSVVIPSETNYLLNPLHPFFAKIAIGEAQEFVTDLRLIRSS
ncbi:RES family NAD+ phosphorylase [Aromatoleum petrolei]|uniref:RES domain-containing protein n=1 Tax=Aromatoleum petrolei TaxID=76116 RepID=A0ABX1MI83_9RHOO|nr:RES family NAD+ phosphorylase [Aromatoleum petrolei]NMF87653.1 RES domain-containing protein [Aromatoleum petrolei]QTQ38754.1 RES domain-containing protein [Aromatoleum petrolei]